MWDPLRRTGAVYLQTPIFMKNLVTLISSLLFRGHFLHLQRYVLNLMDTYGAGFAVIWIALWEVIALMWIYGVCNFSKVNKISSWL